MAVAAALDAVLGAVPDPEEAERGAVVGELTPQSLGTATDKSNGRHPGASAHPTPRYADFTAGSTSRSAPVPVLVTAPVSRI
ncbi:hypothetical protein FMUAM8_22510 [Nocardia cyriacigeorgica]|nr:hypothetical protein FMUAM8_22510 [Nocardia cyriacigeorgica]